MKFLSTDSKKVLTCAFILASVSLSACGKSVSLVGRAGGAGANKGEPASDTPDVPKGSSCGDQDRAKWRWSQPQPSVSKGVDLLFVVDSSLSLTPERRKVAKAISSFLDTLPADADTRIAVLLGHGENSRWNGKLYSRGSDPRVIVPSGLPRDRAEELLTNSLSCPALDFGLGNGEMLMSSLQASLEEGRFAEIQTQGFYRSDALLAVVFLTDENDGCFDPLAHGYTHHPHYKPSALGLEPLAYQKFCLDAKGAVKVSTTSVLNALRSRFPAKRITMAGIVHSKASSVPYWAEDSIGHGIIDLIEENASSQPTGPTSPLVLDLKTADFSATLNQLATKVSSYLDLQTQFEIPGSIGIDEESILVTVDGTEVTASYEPTTRTLTIPRELAGGAGSQIDVSACSL